MGGRIILRSSGEREWFPIRENTRPREEGSGKVPETRKC